MQIAIRSSLMIILIGLFECAAVQAGIHDVVRVIDGDTFILDDGRRIQLLGVDAPEINDRLGLNKRHSERTGIPSDRLDTFAGIARDYLRELIEGKRVDLRLDPLNYAIRSKDEFGRTLANVYLTDTDAPSVGESSDGDFVNASMVRSGNAFAYSRYASSKIDLLRSAENQAQKSRAGFWNKTDQT